MSLKDFGTVFKIARIQKNLSQRQLGDLLGVSRAVLGRWEQGCYVPNGRCLLDLIVILDLNAKNINQELKKKRS